MASLRAIRVRSGDLINPFELAVADVGRVDFVHSLSQINRYTGHVEYPYSVMQHSLVLYHAVPWHLRKAALIHDFSEVFFNDLASPVKSKYTGYKHDEKTALRAVAEFFEVRWSDIEEVSDWDKRLYKDESRHLFLRITEQGKGDDRQKLGVDPYYLRERDWRSVRSEGYKTMQHEFGYTGATVL